MTRHFVKVLFDVHCEWTGKAPGYRVYVNDELFTERTYNFTDAYLEEMLQIDAPVGDYIVRCELVQPAIANIRMENLRVDYGPANIIEGVTLRIKDEMA